MKVKQFAPQYLVVRTGDTVEFPNLDNFDHNVFSPDERAKFDLGSYSINQSKSVKFDLPGVFRIYCNLHSQMASFILATKMPWAAVTAREGTFFIPGVPKGTYTMRIWNLRGQTQREISVGPLTEPILINLNTLNDKIPEHLNKFGKPYKTEEVFEVY